MSKKPQSRQPKAPEPVAEQPKAPEPVKAAPQLEKSKTRTIQSPIGPIEVMRIMDGEPDKLRV